MIAIDRGHARRSKSGYWLLVASVVTSISTYAFAQQKLSVEQDRQAVIQILQTKFPGMQPTDWGSGSDGLPGFARGETLAIPFNSENVANSADILAIGKKRWDRKFKDGKSLNFCFPNGGKRVATTYPQFDARIKAVVTLEMAINRCLQLHGEPEVNFSESEIGGALMAHFRSLSEGQKISVRVVGVGAREKYDEGRTLFARRMGQQNNACASCHLLMAGSKLGNQLISPVVGQASNWPRLEAGGHIRLFQEQMRLCMLRTGAEPFPIGSEELNNLEYYLAYLSNTMPMRVLTIQR